MFISHKACFWFSGCEFAEAFYLKPQPMKQLIHLYQNNPVVHFIFDGIALIVCAVTAIFTITMLTIACAI